jgi:hypothetical protein
VLAINLACSWTRPKRDRAKRAGKEYAEPWYLGGAPRHPVLDPRLRREGF